MTEPCPRRCGYLLRGPLDECPNCMPADLDLDLRRERAEEDDQ